MRCLTMLSRSVSLGASFNVVEYITLMGVVSSARALLRVGVQFLPVVKVRKRSAEKSPLGLNTRNASWVKKLHACIPPRPQEESVLSPSACAVHSRQHITFGSIRPHGTHGRARCSTRKTWHQRRHQSIAPCDHRSRHVASLEQHCPCLPWRPEGIRFLRPILNRRANMALKRFTLLASR